jgi:hypothetical protein
MSIGQVVVEKIREIVRDLEGATGAPGRSPTVPSKGASTAEKLNYLRG